MKKILISAPVRQDEEIFNLYLDSLRSLYIPDGYKVDKMFVFHNCDHLVKKLNITEKACIHNDDTSYKCSNKTHEWKDENFKEVVLMKNFILKYAKEHNYDYVFLVDSDLILHQNTLVKLIEAKKDMVVEVFWTKWDNDNPNMEQLPNAWNMDNYTIAPSELGKWKTKGLYPVGMAGACTLLSKYVLDKNINFTPVPNVSWTIWEDRAFCIRAMCAGIQPWLDTHHPAIHLYRKSELEKYKKGELKHEVF